MIYDIPAMRGSQVEQTRMQMLLGVGGPLFTHDDVRPGCATCKQACGSPVMGFAAPSPIHYILDPQPRAGLIGTAAAPPSLTDSG